MGVNALPTSLASFIDYLIRVIRVIVVPWTLMFIMLAVPVELASVTQSIFLRRRVVRWARTPPEVWVIETTCGVCQILGFAPIKLRR